MTSINERLYQYIVVEEMHPDLAARLAIENSPVDELMEMFLPLAKNWAKRIARNNTRNHEDAVFSGSSVVLHDEMNGHAVQYVSWADTTRRLLDLGFSLPDGRYVTYAESTAADHRMRATWQRGRASSIVVDAERHEQLADLIDSHGVHHLGQLDIEDWKELVPNVDMEEVPT